MTRVLIAPQEYKGTMTAVEAAAAIADGLRRRFPGIDIDLAPMADGGPGTAAALVAAMGGEWRSAEAHDPLMRPIKASWALLSTGTAVVECASASGLLLLQEHELNPGIATTFGTGELIGAALAQGCTSIILGLGGSATNDGGAGMAHALGFHLLDAAGRDLEPGGAALRALSRIEGRAAHAGIAGARFVAATDVRNPLCGPDGASAVYGPQKGAGPDAIAALDAALLNFAAVVLRDLGLDIRDEPGAGAAGGLGAGAMAFLGATIRPGAQVVGDAANLALRVRSADLVITGEGRLDGQTAAGKTPAYVAGLARDAGKPVLCLPGSLGPGHETALALFDLVVPLVGPGRGGGLSAPGRSLAEVAVEAALGAGL